MPVYAQQLAEPVRPAVIGGHSYGGRVASMLAASGDPGVRGLVLLSYPLHRPGHPDDLRTEHWPGIHCPVLFLSGDADPFARIDTAPRGRGELDARAELVVVSAAPAMASAESLADALDQVAAFVPHAVRALAKRYSSRLRRRLHVVGADTAGGGCPRGERSSPFAIAWCTAVPCERA